MENPFKPATRKNIIFLLSAIWARKVITLKAGHGKRTGQMHG